jgi:hypothetical protein
MRNVFKSSVPKIQKGRDCLENLATYEREKRRQMLRNLNVSLWTGVMCGLG